MTFKLVARTFAWLAGLIIAAALLLSALMPVKAHAQSYIARPLTSWTIFATGASFTDPFSIGARLAISPSAGGYAIVRLVSPLSFFFNFEMSRSVGLVANLSSYFLPGNTVGEYRVLWGNFLSVVTPTVLNSAAGRATITIMEME